MKKIYLIAIILMAVNCSFSQNDSLLNVLPLKGGKVYYSEVVAVDSTKMMKLYSRVKSWFVNSFKSANDVIQNDDKENGEVVGKGSFEEVWKFGMFSQVVKVHCTYKISLKDNKYKYEIYNFRIKFSTAGNKYASGQDIDLAIEEAPYKLKPKGQKELFKKIDERIKRTIISLKTAMSEKESDW